MEASVDIEGNAWGKTDLTLCPRNACTYKRLKAFNAKGYSPREGKNVKAYQKDREELAKKQQNAIMFQ